MSGRVVKAKDLNFQVSFDESRARSNRVSCGLLFSICSTSNEPERSRNERGMTKERLQMMSKDVARLVGRNFGRAWRVWHLFRDCHIGDGVCAALLHDSPCEVTCAFWRLASATVFMAWREASLRACDDVWLSLADSELRQQPRSDKGEHEVVL